MKLFEKKNKKILVYIFAWSIIPLAYFSWGLSTLSTINPFFTYIAGIVGIGSATIYFLLNRYVYKFNCRYVKELKSINLVIVILGFLFLLQVNKEYPQTGRWVICLAIVTWILLSSVLIIRSITTFNIAAYIKQHLGIILLLIITGLLSIDTDMFQYKWDGLLYYIATRDAELRSIAKTGLYGHIAMTTGVIYRFFAVLFGNICVGMSISNMVILLLSVAAFYGIVKEAVPGKREITYLVSTACFASSPFLLGMVNYFSTDWFAVCTVVFLAYFVIKKQWIWATICSCLFCMSKEPSLIAYAGLCIGLVIYDLTTSKSFKNGLIKVLCTGHYYFMMIPYILWIVTYKILGKWSAGSGGFGINPEYMFDKLKVFLCLNFNWIPVFGITLCIVVLIKDGQIKKVLAWLLPLLCSNICLLLFNLLFVTINHPRYIDSFISIKLILFILLLLSVIRTDKSVVLIGGVFAVLSLISCYATIDPISKALFRSHNVGNGVLISTGSLFFGDGAIYNRQMLWMEKPINAAISSAIEDKTDIVLSIADNSVYSFDGMSKTIGLNDDINEDVLYWNNKTEHRIPYADENVSIAEQYDIYHVKDGIPVDNIGGDNDKISVIYIRGINEYSYSDDYHLISSEDYAYRGWIITRDVLEKTES